MAVPTSKARGIRARLNLMGCVDFATGEVQYRDLDHNTTASDTVAFVDTLAQQAEPACPTVLFLDRASVHTAGAVFQHRDRWREQGLLLVHLPPYSPELNLMEGKWRQLKYHDLPHRHQTSKLELRQAVQQAHWGVAI